VADQGAELPGALDPAPTDVTDETSVRALFDRTVQRHGRLDLLRHQQPRGGRIINNGSISAHVPRPRSVPYHSCCRAP
jgi:NAD(P)-dependent dehydrogenase (short-subunit alcohol dehydrogenase family)